jgi:carboxymethylenebutenolidase
MNIDADVESLGDEGRPPVLLLHPWWGITPAVGWWADQLVDMGRRVVLPDLYGGRVAETIAEAAAFEESLDYDTALVFIGTIADQLTSEGQPWAAMGFSMGAFMACQLAARGAAGPSELVLFYGGSVPDGTDVQTKLVSLHVAPVDEYFGVDEVEATEGTFRSHGATVVTYTYPGTGHWFAEDGSPAFDEAATQLALGRVVAQLTV